MSQHPFRDDAGGPVGAFAADEVAGFRWRADGFNAARLVMAALDEDIDEAERILTDNPAVPLMSGLLAVALVLGEVAAGGDTDKLRRVLDVIMLSPTLDAAGTADAYRARRAS